MPQPLNFIVPWRPRASVLGLPRFEPPTFIFGGRLGEEQAESRFILNYGRLHVFKMVTLTHISKSLVFSYASCLAARTSIRESIDQISPAFPT